MCRPKNIPSWARATATTTSSTRTTSACLTACWRCWPTCKARHHVLAVATGKSRRGLDEALQAVELRGMFDGSRTADETAGKPHPRMLHELMRRIWRGARAHPDDR
jgi:beta-phosphoglucomutase-like phosphatase (HAD superfamily)